MYIRLLKQKRIRYIKGVGFVDTDTKIASKTLDDLVAKVIIFEREFEEWCDSFSNEPEPMVEEYKKAFVGHIVEHCKNYNHGLYSEKDELWFNTLANNEYNAQLESIGEEDLKIMIILNLMHKSV